MITTHPSSTTPAAAPAASSAARPPIAPRSGPREFADVPKHWFAGLAVPTQISNGVNLLFPAGERFFVRSVYHYLERIEDPALRAAIKGFGGQEGAPRPLPRGLLRDHAGPGLRDRSLPQGLRVAELHAPRARGAAGPAPGRDRRRRALHRDHGGRRRRRHAPRARPPGDAPAPVLARRRGARAQVGGLRRAPAGQLVVRAAHRRPGDVDRDAGVDVADRDRVPPVARRGVAAGGPPRAALDPRGPPPPSRSSAGSSCAASAPTCAATSTPITTTTTTWPASSWPRPTPPAPSWRPPGGRREARRRARGRDRRRQRHRSRHRRRPGRQGRAGW
jgi:hypothetical protein